MAIKIQQYIGVSTAAAAASAKTSTKKGGA